MNQLAQSIIVGLSTIIFILITLFVGIFILYKDANRNYQELIYDRVKEFKEELSRLKKERSV
jgi:hypothetical protein